MEKETNQQKIDIDCIIRDILKDLWVAVIVGISAAFLAYAGGKSLYQATYTSQTTFVVSAKKSSMGAYENMEKTQKLTDMFRSVMDSQILKKKVGEKLGIGAFPGTVGISVVPETNLLTVSVTADSPDMALRLLKGLLECYPEIGQKVLGEVVMEVFEEPGYPSVPDQRFDGRTVMKKAFFMGFLFIAALLALISYMKDTVKNEKEIPLKLDTTAIGALHHERRYKNVKDFLKRKKKRIFVTEPSVSFGYIESVKKIRTKLLYQMKKNEAQVVMITSAMQGEGKTTFAMNLAQVLSQRSRKVLLIEGNLRNPGLAQCMQLDMEKIPSWGEYFEGKKELKDAIIQPDGYGFQVLVNQDKIQYSTELLASDKMEDFIKQMRNEVDIILIDAPHVKKRSDTEVLARISDLSVIVVKQNDTLAKYINDSIDMLNSYGEGVVGCIFNDVTNGSRVLSSGYGYGYGRYGGYGKYGRYGHYGYYGHYAAQHENAKKESGHE